MLMNEILFRGFDLSFEVKTLHKPMQNYILCMYIDINSLWLNDTYMRQ